MGFLDKVGQSLKKVGQTVAEEVKKRQEILETKKRILSRFEMKDLKKACSAYGVGEPSKYEENFITSERHRRTITRDHYIKHVIGNLNLEQIKNFASKNRIDIWDIIKEEKKPIKRVDEVEEKPTKEKQVTKIEVSRQSEFDNMLEEIENEFEPEDCRDEKELEKILTMFLKNKYSAERQVKTQKGTIDILVNNKYVLEVKIADSKSSLDKGISEVKKYGKIYDNIAVIIFDVNKLGWNTIKEYVEDYQDLGAKTVVIRGEVKRKKRKSTQIIIKH